MSLRSLRQRRRISRACRAGIAFAVIVTSTGLAVIGLDPTQSAGASTAGTAIGGRACSPSSWTSYLHDPSNSGSNSCNLSINKLSVGALGADWQKTGLVGVTGVPVVADHVVYYGDETGTEWAAQTTTGNVLWSTKVAAGVVGSATIAGNALYVGAGATLYRLDRQTGAVVWKVTTNPNPFSQINASPVVVGNEVIIGTASFEVTIRSSTYSFQGSIGAFDTQTGKPLWNFITTPNNATSGAGEGIWSTAAVDQRLGLLFVGTGQNLAPPPGPLEDSILAIDLRTGKLVWSMQATSDDVFSFGYPSGFDFDFGASPNLFSVHGRDLVGDASKAGTYYALDARTGQLVWKRKLSPGGPFGGALGSAAYIDGRIIASANIGSPSTKSTTNECKVVAINPSNGKIVWTHRLIGNVYGPITGTSTVAFVGTTTGGSSGVTPTVGSYAALDPDTGRLLWQRGAPAAVGGGAAVVGNQVFWGYGYTLFSGPGPGGLIAFSLPSRRPVNRLSTGRCAPSAACRPGGVRRP